MAVFLWWAGAVDLCMRPLRASFRSIFFVVALGCTGALGASFLSVHTFPRLSAAVIDRVPVARAEGQFIPFDSFRRRTERNVRLWQGSADPHVVLLQAEQAALQDLVTERIVSVLLLRAGGDRVSDTDVEAEFGRMVRLAGGSDAFREELQRYGWDEAAFKEETVRPAVERSALEQRFLAHLPTGALPSDREAYQRAQKLRSEVKAGAIFKTAASTVAADTSEQASLNDLGWITPSSLDPWFRDALNGASAGSVVGPVRSPAGYHVLFVSAVQQTPNEGPLLHLSEALFFAPDVFSPWLAQQVREASVSLYLPNMQWKNGTIVVAP